MKKTNGTLRARNYLDFPLIKGVVRQNAWKCIKNVKIWILLKISQRKMNFCNPDVSHMSLSILVIISHYQKHVSDICTSHKGVEMSQTSYLWIKNCGTLPLQKFNDIQFFSHNELLWPERVLGTMKLLSNSYRYKCL